MVNNMIKANIEVLEEISQLLNLLAVRQDEMHNLAVNIRAEMEDDAEFLLYPQGVAVCQRLDDAIISMNRSLYIMQSLCSILEKIPDRYKEIENDGINGISEIITRFESIKAGAEAVLNDPLITIPDCYIDSESAKELNDVMNYDNSIPDIADIALITSIIDEEYKVDKVENWDNSD